MSEVEHSPNLPLKQDLDVELVRSEGLSEAVTRARAMHNETVAACDSFHTLFCERHRDGKAADDHYEQDLLRAMLLFACSGLDAVVKQLVRDTLKEVIANDLGAQGQFAKYIERRLKRGIADESDRATNGQPALDFALLSSVLASPEPRAALIEALTRTLTSDSLQSRDQLLKVAAHFALTRDDVLAADKVTKEAFDARNQLAHEMDIDFRAEHRRRDRKYGDMVRWSENILEVGRKFIMKVAEKLPSSPGTSH